MKYKKILSKALTASLLLMCASSSSAQAQERDEDSTILNTIKSYNVWSFGDVEASHIVGPIVAKDSAYHYENHVNRLDFSNLSQGVSSYVGDVSKALVTYLYDFRLNPNFIPPILYTSFIPDDLQVYGEVGVNSEYIDFGLTKETMLLESKAIYDLPNQEIEGAESIELAAGETYLIKQIENVKNVNIVFPGGQDTSYIEPTIINIEGQWYTFPSISVNGEVFNGSINPEGGPSVDFGTGTSIIWNAPYTSGTLFKAMSSSDLLGHVIAPEADFVNEMGGNLNGSMIVNSFHGKLMELHSFPFIGSIEQPEEEKNPGIEPEEPNQEPEEEEVPGPDPEIPEIEPELPSPETPGPEIPEVEPELPSPDEPAPEPELPEQPLLPEVPENPELPELPEGPLLPEIEHPELDEPELDEQEPPKKESLPTVEVKPEPPKVEELPQTGLPNVAGILGFGLTGLGISLLKRKKS